MEVALTLLISCFPVQLLDELIDSFAGSFAAALTENKLDCWVLNVVPVSGPNTLPVIYDRGLIGVMHDWYEFDDVIPLKY